MIRRMIPYPVYIAAGALGSVALDKAMTSTVLDREFDPVGAMIGGSILGIGTALLQDRYGALNRKYLDLIRGV